jgi:hypothetical protein
LPFFDDEACPLLMVLPDEARPLASWAVRR